MLPLLWFVVVSETVLHSENFSCAISVNYEGRVSQHCFYFTGKKLFFPKVDNIDGFCLAESYFFQIDSTLVEDHGVFPNRK